MKENLLFGLQQKEKGKVDERVESKSIYVKANGRFCYITGSAITFLKLSSSWATLANLLKNSQSTYVLFDLMFQGLPRA